MSSEKIRAIEGYVENAPYGNKSLASEIHGPANQATINQRIKSLVEGWNIAKEGGDNDLASALKSGIYKIAKGLKILQNKKEEYVADLHTRSNWTDHGWDDNFMTEKGVIDVSPEMNLVLGAYDPTTGTFLQKGLDDITRDWESIGDWMQTLMQGKQDLVKAKGGLNTPPPFDIDFFTNNLLKKNWRSILTDPDPTLNHNDYHNGYRLQQILHTAADANGNIPIDYNLDKNSFDPTNDTRLFEVISNDLKTAFNPNYQTSNEAKTADELMNRIS